jgi:hypothetical protein
VLLVLLYVGVPLCFLGGTAAVSALWAGQADDHAFNHQAQLLPAAEMLIGAWVGWAQRHRTAVWASAGAWIGGVAAFFLAFYAYAMQIGEPFDAPYHLLVYAGALLLPIGWLLGRWARRILLDPPVAELADTPYELVYPLRGAKGVRLYVGADVVAVQEWVMVRHGTERRKRWKAAGSHRLDAVGTVAETGLSGAERLEPALALERPLPSSPGPALVVDGPGGRWVLPLDEAVAIGWIVTRRIAAATGGP